MKQYLKWSKKNGDSPTIGSFLRKLRFNEPIILKKHFRIYLISYLGYTNNTYVKEKPKGQL